ncbi:conserved hypothetical protein [Xenorhabdus nematophila ATCC 19061]|uniref:Uncharacterized protein n=1 Tax=Xenorhabdus nematophila (strain ATCC 19061 / DSM 3370 / CCUG 14189 / LMG 1036 / NCIMB 9965 / AN6) TaxID=406817 RepID=D3VK04_XENNA|nr:conserved hypothetical protein [Xenorhabdus nematophila ATCC 19061]
MIFHSYKIMIAPMKINLTNDQKTALELMHDTPRDGRVRDRIKAVLLASEGWTDCPDDCPGFASS